MKKLLYILIVFSILFAALGTSAFGSSMLSAAPAKPTLSSPGNGSTWSQSTVIELKWNSVAGATGYKVELWGGPYTTMVPCNWTSGTSCSIGNMWPGTMSWRVKARNATGEGDWSDPWSFVIQDGGGGGGGGGGFPVPPPYIKDAPCITTKAISFEKIVGGKLEYYIELTIANPPEEVQVIKTATKSTGAYSDFWQLNSPILTLGSPINQWDVADHSQFPTDGELPAIPEGHWRISIPKRVVLLQPWSSIYVLAPGSMVYLRCKTLVIPTNYDQLLRILNGWSIVSPVSGSQLRIPVNIPSWMSYIQTSLNIGSKATITLIAPDGTVYSPTNPAVTYVDTPSFAVHTLNLDSPKGGTWQVVIDVIAAESDSVFMLNVYGKQINVPSNDNIPPVTGMHFDGTKGQNGWFTSDVTVTLSAEDNPGGSGIKGLEWSMDNGATWQTYTSPFVISQEGLSYVLGRSYDNAGNYDQSPIGKFLQIDKTPPVVNVSTDQTEYTRVQPFVVHYNCTDPEPGSGIAGCTATFNGQSASDGQSIDMFWWKLGQYTLTATGVDNAGWTTTNSKTIQLIATIQSLQKTVERLCAEKYITKQGICKSLQQKLRAALSAQQRGQKATAANILRAFQNQITAQKGKAVKVQAYDLLMMDSSYVISTLGGKK